MGTKMTSTTDNDAILGGQGATELVGDNVVGLYAFAKHMLPRARATQCRNYGPAARTSAFLAL
jgi:hypothetical protein